MRHEGHGRGRAAPGRRGRSRQSRQPWLPLRARPRLARDHRQPAAPPASAGSRSPGCPVPHGRLGRGARPHRGGHARGRARGGRALVRPRVLRHELRRSRELGAAAPLRQPVGLPVVGADHDLLGAGRVRAGPHRAARDQHQGRPGGPRAPGAPVGREPGESAQHGTPPPGGPAARSRRGHDRRAAHRGRGALGPGAAAAAGDRRRARAGHDARADRRESVRPRVRGPAHRGLRSARRPRVAPHPGVGRGDLRRRRGDDRGARAPLRDDPARHDRAGRQQHAQGRLRVAGRPRGGVSARAHREPRDSGRRPGAAPREQGPRSRPRRHRGVGAASTRPLHPEPDAAHHRGARGRAGPRVAALRHRHAVVVRGRGPGGAGARPHLADRDPRPLPERHRAAPRGRGAAGHRVARGAGLQGDQHPSLPHGAGAAAGGRDAHRRLDAPRAGAAARARGLLPVGGRRGADRRHPGSSRHRPRDRGRAAGGGRHARAARLARRPSGPGVPDSLRQGGVLLLARGGPGAAPAAGPRGAARRALSTHAAPGAHPGALPRLLRSRPGPALARRGRAGAGAVDLARRRDRPRGGGGLPDPGVQRARRHGSPRPCHRSRAHLHGVDA